MHASVCYLFNPVGYSLLLEQQPDLLAVRAPSRVVPVEDDARFFGSREDMITIHVDTRTYETNQVCTVQYSTSNASTREWVVS